MQALRRAPGAATVLAVAAGVFLGLNALGAVTGAGFAADSTADAVDAEPGDGVCATAAGECTLRAAAGGEATATVSGFVFHDLDRDGVRDEGEPGLRRIVQLVQLVQGE